MGREGGVKGKAGGGGEVGIKWEDVEGEGTIIYGNNFQLPEINTIENTVVSAGAVDWGIKL